MNRCRRMVILLVLCAVPALARDIYREAEAFFDEARYAEAAARYEEFLAKKPESALVPSALFALAWSHIHAGSGDSALDALRRLEASGEHDRAADLFFYTYGNAFLVGGNDAQAIFHFQRLGDEHPGSALLPDARRLIAAAETRRRNYAEALAELDRLEESGTTDEDLAKRYEIHRKLRDYEKALEALNRRIPIAAAPEAKAELIFEKAQVEERLGRSTRDTLERYIREFPAGPRAARAHRMLAESTDDSARRIYHYAAAVLIGDVEPFAAENRLALAEARRAAGDEAGAISEWKALITGHIAASEARSALEQLEAQPRELIEADEGFLRAVESMILADDVRLNELGLFWPLAEASAVWRGWRKPSPDELAARLQAPADSSAIFPAADTEPRPRLVDVPLSIPRSSRPVRLLIAPPDFGRGLEHLRPLPFWIRERLSRAPEFQAVDEERWWAFQNGGDVADVAVRLDADRQDGLLWIRYILPGSGIPAHRRFAVPDWKRIPYDEIAGAIESDLLQAIRRRPGV